jgi:chemotaxis family two-component system sensor histidine kinase/response regulator PixL
MAPRVPEYDPGPQPTVLVVDDDYETRMALQELLSEAGYRVADARDGREALDYLEGNPPPDAILADLFMPTMNGWEFVARVKREPLLAGTPILVLTATGPHWGYPVAPDLVIRKPFRTEQLLNLLRKTLLEGKRPPTRRPV